MTIAACYVSSEGVVLGSDSATTFGLPNKSHKFKYAQKLFEIGESSTIGVVTWGLGGLNSHSHRTLFARLGDDLIRTPPRSVKDVAERWIDQFWAIYNDPNSPLGPFVSDCRALTPKRPHNSASAAYSGMRTHEEEMRLAATANQLVAGFCIAGRLAEERDSFAFQVIFEPVGSKPSAQQLPPGWQFWGAPNMMQRLIFGCDEGIKTAILKSGRWNGSDSELDSIIGAHALQYPVVPIREAIDFIHACIASTINAFKYSSTSQFCGGPIEIAVIASDQQFRWVRHKTWDAAIINNGGA